MPKSDFKLTPEWRQKIKDYFDYHGDTNVRIKRKLVDSHGHTGILCHVNTEGGGEYSVIVDFPTDSHGDRYVTEFSSCPIEDEAGNIDWFEHWDEMAEKEVFPDEP